MITPSISSPNPDIAVKCAENGGIMAGRFVRYIDEASLAVVRCSGQSDQGIAGVSLLTVQAAGRSVIIRTQGIVRVFSLSSLKPGDFVVPYSEGSVVKALFPRVELPSGAVVRSKNLAGLSAAGFSVALQDPNGISQPLSFDQSALMERVIRIELATSGSGIPSTTLSQLSAFVSGHPVLSGLIEIEMNSADPSGIVEPITAGFSVLEASTNVVGMAVERCSANQAVAIQLWRRP